MNPKSILGLAAIALLIFAGGISLGQETARSNLREYLTPSQASEMDWAFLHLQINEISDALNILEESGAPERTGVPVFSINPKTGKIQVLLSVHGNWVDAAPLKDVEELLKDQAQATVSGLKFYLPQVRDGDVIVYFTKINMRKNEIVNNFAEYENGQLTLHR